MQDNICVVDDTKECKKGYDLKNGKCVGKDDLLNFYCCKIFIINPVNSSDQMDLSYFISYNSMFSFLSDINECIVGKSSPCHASLKCLNFEGSFRCVEKCTISNGYRLVYSQGKEFCVGKFRSTSQKIF